MRGGEFSIPLLHNTVGIMTPFLLAAVGGLFTELAGMLNIALEGLMLFGAFFAIVSAGYTGSLLAGVLLGVAFAMLAAALFGAVSLYLKANVFIAGLATNLLAACRPCPSRSSTGSRSSEICCSDTTCSCTPAGRSWPLRRS
jgi:ABC-type uncharacterized transport system permease subunit